MIAILDFGSAGNVASVANAFARVGVEAKLVGAYDAADDDGKFSGLVIPGVGSFSVVPKIAAALGGRDEARKIRVPVLCICLGMQAMFERSEETEGVQGLEIVEGEVRKLAGSVRLPQLGWNKVKLVKDDALFDGINDGEYFYFANSYASFPKEGGAVVAETEYGETFASAVRKGNWWGVQFHPEKSGRSGERLLKNYAEMCGKKTGRK